ncbi:MAG: capsid protein [Novo Mesto dicistrovirus 1]|nr:MAG: capsid protein [Novo Mesto dicistrovirus 1]
MLQNTSSAQHMDDTVSIVQFLQRPIKLAHFQLTATANTKSLNPATFGQEQPSIAQWNLPYDILNKGGKLEKANNHQYFKADIKVKIILNANPFIAGRFWLTYSPYEDTVTGARQQKYASRAGVTAYPGVEIDAQLDNAVEMLIPYASYKEAYVLTTEQPENFVKLSLYPLTPVLGPLTAAAAVIDMAVYAWFENVTINIPTCKTLTNVPAQKQIQNISSKDRDRLREARKLEKLEKTNPSIYEYIQRYLNPSKTIDAPPVARNMRKVRDVNGRVIEGEDIPDSWPGMRRIEVDMQVQGEDTSQGPISGIASIVGGIADAAGKIPIPIVGEIASGVSWVANIVGNIASIFGWSRPTHMKEICELANVPGKNYTHIEAIDMGVNLSLSNRNELDKAYSIFPSAADEMDLAYCCANPALKEVYVWQVASENYNSLQTIGLLPVGIGPFNRYVDSSKGKLCPMNPYTFTNSLTDGYQKVLNDALQAKIEVERGDTMEVQPYVSAGISVLDTAPCEYISQLFTYWRATICFKISVVKTAFHSGRLEIFFDPGPYFSTPSGPDLERYNDIDTTNNYKYILDLTNDTEVTIRIPFVSEKLFKRTISANRRAGKSDDLLPPPAPEDIFDSMIGSLVIRPVSNLLAPETVADSVRILVWKWAEDVVLGVPKPPTQDDLKIIDGSDPKGDAKCPTAADFTPSAILNMKLGNSKCPNQVVKSVTMQINIGNKADGNVVTFFDTTNVEQENMNACKNALGERITSLRPLLRCFRNILKVGQNLVVPDEKAEDPISFGKPFIHDFQEDFMDKSTFFTDYVSYLSYMYRFFRGGNRIKFITTSYKLDDSQDITTEIPHLYSSIAKKGANRPSTGPSHMTFQNLNPVHEVTVPYYSQYRKLPISPKRKDPTDWKDDENIMNLEITSNCVTNGFVMRSGNDDLTYGWLMGTPQLLVGVSTFEWNSYCITKVNNIPIGQ